MGRLDVCPVVSMRPTATSTSAAVELARATGRAIAAPCDLPVYFYGDAAVRPGTRTLAAIRRGGLKTLKVRATDELPPDIGPPRVDLSRGVVCVGARRPMIAFNVWLEGGAAAARRIASRVRTTNGGPIGVLALGWELPNTPHSQVSMNLIEPDRTGIGDAFDAVAREALAEDVAIAGTEVVGMVPERLIPSPAAEVSQLFMTPVRSLDEALRRLDETVD